MITSRQNPLIKEVRALRRARTRRERGLFLIEGIFHVGEAVAAGWQLETLLYAPDLLTSVFARRLVQDYEAAGGVVRAVAAEIFADLTGKDNPQGVLAIGRRRVETLTPQSAAPPRSVALVAPQDPGNVGTILRTLDAVGADALFLLDGGVDPFHPTLVRASMGALFWKPIYCASRADFWAWAQAQGIWVLGTSAHAARGWRDLRPPAGQPSALLFGSEQKGLSAEDLSACAETVSLPMRGRTTSLNLAVAAGVLLYALWG